MDRVPSQLTSTDTDDGAGRLKPPPMYEARDSASRPPPVYSPPSSYKVGGKVLTTPLVHVHQLKAHLGLLRAFKNLRAAAEDVNETRLGSIDPPLEPAQLWAWLVGLAVDRFVVVCRQLSLATWYNFRCDIGSRSGFKRSTCALWTNGSKTTSLLWTCS